MFLDFIRRWAFGVGRWAFAYFLFLRTVLAVIKRSCPIRRHSVKTSFGAADRGQPTPPTAPGAFPPPMIRGAIKNRNSLTSPARISAAASAPPPSHNTCKQPRAPSFFMSAVSETLPCDPGRTQTWAPVDRQAVCLRAGHWRVVAMIVCAWCPSVKILALDARVPRVSTMTRHGRRPPGGLGNSTGSSASTVRAPTRMASALRRQT